mmetsp:Transcript_28607/g.42313  ORF Transcript_28607/g.42313 Transcript_28607/m.42313 type:complete len:297 (-) Transcript_28607:311-1201(-)|eukprot:CAMPEP_0195526972 /NCGR_PEP_ID=MMETSP0794_2-20130614/28341_1 /TAXON_ID=515487 /ORGANISM="Stephanopyxis turris, Strain CCMP 815" /LENGTH=296 /DNA_ID=CAMNT_0040657775 /DNA_START=104 /DNA_END=994 /DNA_ORIENTATION=-
MKFALLSVISCPVVVGAFSPSFISQSRHLGLKTTIPNVPTKLYSMSTDDAPSDYDVDDLENPEQTVAVDKNEDDEAIRDALKRELLLFSSVTDRGEFATKDERAIIVDLITQLEALNPTEDPALNCEGDWDLCLTSTQSFRSSPFFMAIRAAVGDDNKDIALNGFDIHERATSAGKVGRVRQSITKDELISEVDLEVGVLPGLPFTVKGTVVSSASLDTAAPATWKLRVQGTKVTGSNVPFLDQYLDDYPLEVPVGDAYSQVLGSVPVAEQKTFYVDEGIRITRDVDDEFFVFARA